MLKGFKDFILRGNVIELSTAVIIGSAFTAIVTAVSDHLINPIIALFGGANVDGFAYHLREGNEATLVDLGAIITAALNFLIVAAVVYFIIIMPMNKFNEATQRRRGIDPEEPAPTTEELLAEIRDLLEANKASAVMYDEKATNNRETDIDGGRHQA